MRLGQAAIRVARRLRLPHRTIRLRLALLYGGVFFISGAVLLALTFAAVAAHTHGAYSHAVPLPPLVQSHVARAIRPGGQPPGSVNISIVDSNQRNVDLRVLAIASVIALAVTAAVSIGLGWLVAGRVLRPLRTITTTARDISATNLHRRLALGGPQDEFKELGDTFDGLLERLDASFQSQRQFVANASHELRTPLARLKTLAQVALSDPNATTGSLRAAHERVLVSEQELEELIEALLVLASSERGLDQREPLDLAALIGQTIAARRPEIERQGLQLTERLGEARTEGNPQLLERLAANLVDNALRHNTAAGRIEISTTTKSDRAIISVSNTGALIPPDQVARLLQPFQRLGSERTRITDGHGLGLTIVRSIATAHGATLAARARAEGGLEIEVSFPTPGGSQT